MTHFIIDDENIDVDNIFDVVNLKEGDELNIVSNTAKKIGALTLARLSKMGVSIGEVFTIGKQRKDFADKIIVFLMGKLCGAEGKIGIVSNDKFYDDVIEFFNNLNYRKNPKFEKISLTSHAVGASAKQSKTNGAAEKKAEKPEPKTAKREPKAQKQGTKAAKREPKAANSKISKIELAAAEALIPQCVSLQALYAACVAKLGRAKGCEAYREIKDGARARYASIAYDSDLKDGAVRRNAIKLYRESGGDMAEFHNKLTSEYKHAGPEIYKEFKEKLVGKMI
ncbi:hypothetical protein [Campylobacter gracilis]|uniref:PIN-like domain-containing protein n=1 Tax=Campylobacter gracilis RM3268 TaxID=553220 RepID=C8PL89_9BACT|nr:hypothetical protein [Campylobacter gracilis]AKT93152.1 hypothetical protein CGRAC_1732 [Campylobacter gracilis]EEV16504.1 hypothetical protein CAMGR0001_2880 [Campylobacter gracilis RM3268]UEB44677.1 hypothetical protein LK410_06555 [Campylobacter gracilis]SUW78518.1 Uncharacterised protein [Campylobacter gracilis]